MPVMDKTGVNLRAGQLVDINLSGMITARVVKVDEPAILVPGRPAEGRIYLQIALSISYSGTRCPDLYILHTPKESELAAAQSGLVHPNGAPIISDPPVADVAPLDPNPAT